MASALDTFASLTPAAGFRLGALPSDAPHVVSFSGDEDDDDDLVDAYDLEDDGGVVDLSTDMSPTFFESGQLMWEISAHTEAGDEQPCLKRPEIVLTDSSFSMNGFQQDDRVINNKEESFARGRRLLKKSRGHDEVVDIINASKIAVLSGQHCFELLTDENDPLCSSTAQQSAPVECRDTEATSEVPSTTTTTTTTTTQSSRTRSTTKTKTVYEHEHSVSGVTVQADDAHRFEAADCPTHPPVREDGQRGRTQDHLHDPHVFDEQSQHHEHHLQPHHQQSKNKDRSNKTSSSSSSSSAKRLEIRRVQVPCEEAVLMDTLPSLKASSSPCSSVERDAFAIADSASDIFRSHDPVFVIRDDDVCDLSDDKSHEQQMKPPKLTTLSLQPQLENRDSALNCRPRRRCYSPDPSSPRVHVPGCSLKDVFSSAMAKINDVVYSCTHTKQRRREREILKKLQAKSRGSLTPNASSSCGAYRRRNTLIRQKIEGMIDNETKTRSSQKISTKKLQQQTPSSPRQLKKKIGVELRPPLKH